MNLIGAGAAELFLQVFNGFASWPHKSSKECEVLWCRCQGFKENVRRHRDSTMMDTIPEAWRPSP